MTRISLSHLTFVGPDLDPASVEFGPRLTLVRGPSDTGKSFIVDAIDFMLGASRLKEIPERSGYTTVLLGLRLPSGDSVTLSRAVTGGNFGLYEEDLRSMPKATWDQTLSGRHDGRNSSNLSMYLLAQIGLDGKVVRKNNRNDTDSLSFRNVAHLCVITETKMQAETPPALTGDYVNRTKEISVLRLLLQDSDDSGLVPEPPAGEANRLGAAKIGVIDQLISDLDERLSAVGGVEELLAQLTKLNEAVAERGRAVASLADERERISHDLRQKQRLELGARSRLQDTAALSERFVLLLQQYNSDLSRLSMIEEAGNLLGYFQPGICPFCGAEPDAQHLNLICDGDVTYLHESIAAEREKTSRLRDDLVSTLEDLAAERIGLEAQIASLRADADANKLQLFEADQRLQPRRDDLNELIRAKSAIEKDLSLQDQIANLQRVRAELLSTERRETTQAAASIDLRAIRELSEEIAERLAAWDYPIASNVRYDRAEQDLFAGDQLRAAHGKGVRAILHAAFTVGLAQYCLRRDIPHPGFVVLDSPLVTYRPPDQGASDDVDDDGLPEGIASAFYADLEASFEGQVIVMENIDPTRQLTSETVDIRFTKLEGVGRYGFFPVTPGPN